MTQPAKKLSAITAQIGMRASAESRVAVTAIAAAATCAATNSRPRSRLSASIPAGRDKMRYGVKLQK